MPQLAGYVPAGDAPAAQFGADGVPQNLRVERFRQAGGQTDAAPCGLDRLDPVAVPMHEAIDIPSLPQVVTQEIGQRHDRAELLGLLPAGRVQEHQAGVPVDLEWLQVSRGVAATAGVEADHAVREATDYLREKMLALGVQNTGSVSKRALKDAVTQDGETLAARTFNPAFDAARTALFREIESARETGAPLPEPAASQANQASLAVRLNTPSQGEDVGQSNPLEGGRTASAGAVDAGTAAQPAVVPAGGAQAGEVSTSANAYPGEQPESSTSATSQAASLQATTQDAGAAVSRGVVVSGKVRAVPSATPEGGVSHTSEPSGAQPSTGQSVAQAAATGAAAQPQSAVTPTTRLHAGIRSYTPSSQTAQAYFQPGRVVPSYNGQTCIQMPGM